MTGAPLCRYRTSAHADAIRACFQVQLALVQLAFDSRDGRAAFRGPRRRVTGTVLSCHAIRAFAAGAPSAPACRANSP
jgi:hypothetical protein